jgi:Tfp pilus assembly protein PilO
MRSITQRERSLVAILILVVLILGVWIFIFGPIVSGFHNRAERRETLLQQYQANQRSIGTIPRLRRQAERQRSAMASLVLVAPTAASASTALQDRIQRTIEVSGGEVRAIEDASGANQQVRIRASAKMTLGQLTDVLAKMQNEAPHANVETLSITSDEALVSGKLETMEVGFEVSLPLILAKSR